MLATGAWWDEPWVGHQWMAAGFAAVAAVVMRDVSRLLEAAGEGQAYGAGVFTQPGHPGDPAHLEAAARGWFAAAEGGTPVLWWLGAHLIVDLLLFIPALYVLVATVVRAATGNEATARSMARWLVGIDAAETFFTFLVLVVWRSTGLPLNVIHGLAWAKWLWVGFVAGVVILGFTNPASSPYSFQNAWLGINRARHGGWQPPAVTMTSLLVVVGVFAVFVAVPADGPLDQFPDVLRYLISGAPGLTLLLGLFSLAVLLPVAVAVAGLLAVATGPPGGGGIPTVSTRVVLIVASAVAGLTIGTAWLLDGISNWGPLAWVLVPSTLWLLRLGVPSADESETAAGSECDKAEQAEAEEPAEPDAGVFRSRRLMWVGGLTGVVVLVVGIGVLRAALLPILVVGGVNGQLVRWVVMGIVGLVGAVFGGRWAQRLVVTQEARLAGRVLRVGTFVVVWGAAVWLLWWPGQAHVIGTGGVIAVGLASVALLAGLLTWISRTRLRWDLTGGLGWARTPWLGIVVLVWLLAGQLDTRGAYHDVRLTDEQVARTQHRSLERAFINWLDQRCSSPDTEPEPLLMVAAPGGGIRAAYWTAIALDGLVGPADSCAGRSVFALSGVSGGSVGVTTWVHAGNRPAGTATRSVKVMANDDALAAGAAALLTRDLIQPLVGVTSLLEDRAAQIERSWERQGTVFHDADDGARWLGGATGRWKHVVVLNAASVNDGCRVLVTNTGGLPGNPQVTGRPRPTDTLSGVPDCLAAPRSGQTSGPVSASLDLTWMSAEADSSCAHRDLRVTTAALLSARFPYVTPAGALRSCHEPDRVTYVVDGGYYENTGMLTLLQLNAVLAGHIAEYNASRPRGDQVEPWIVMLDNHYRTAHSSPPPSRPRQLFAPLRAVGAAGETLSLHALEQQAAAMASCRNAIPACPDDIEIEARFVRLAPQQSPAVAAPLGWVLSDASRKNLESQLDAQLEDDVARKLQAQLRTLK